MPKMSPSPPSRPVRLRPLTPGEIVDQTLDVYRHGLRVYVLVGLIPALAWALSPPLAVGGSETANALAFSLGVAAMAWLVCVPVIWAAERAWLSGPKGPPPSAPQAWKRMLLRTPAVGLAVAAVMLGTLCGSGLMDLALLLPNSLPHVSEFGGLSAVVSAVSFCLEALGVCLFTLALTTPLLTLPASIVEDVGPWRSLRRGFRLLGGARRTLIFLLMAGLSIELALWGITDFSMEVLMALVPPRARFPYLWTLRGYVGWLTLAVSLPVPAIGLALTYCNQRVIREGYDIEQLLEELPDINGERAQPEESAALS